MTLPLLPLLGLALAGPTFVDGDQKSAHLVQPATQAMAAAERCMGRPADVPATIRLAEYSQLLKPAPDLLMVDRRHAWIGSHTVGIRGNDRFEQDSSDWELRALYHALAHYWAKDSIWALDEGGADFLADCIAVELGRVDLRMGDRTRAVVGEPIVQMGPMFSEPTERHYALAQSWVRALLTQIPLTRLLPREPEDWPAAKERLAPAGLLVKLAEHPLPASALTDADGDWLPSGFERGLGLSDADQHSREDGWWDSAPKLDVPEGTTRIADSTWQCSGWAFPAGATVQFRGLDLQGHWAGTLELAEPRGRVVRGPAPRAIWATAPGKPDPSCQKVGDIVVLHEGSRLSKDQVSAALEPLGGVISGIVVLDGQTRITPTAVHLGTPGQVAGDPGLGFLIEALLGAQEMGVCPDPKLIAEEVRIRTEASRFAKTPLSIDCALE